MDALLARFMHNDGISIVRINPTKSVADIAIDLTMKFDVFPPDEDGESGNEYDLRNETQDTFLDPALTLGDCGVNDGDVLSLVQTQHPPVN